MNAPTEKFALARRGLPLATAAHATLRGTWLPAVSRNRAVAWAAPSPAAAPPAPIEPEDSDDWRAEAMEWVPKDEAQGQPPASASEQAATPATPTLPTTPTPRRIDGRSPSAAPAFAPSQPQAKVRGPAEPEAPNAPPAATRSDAPARPPRPALFTESMARPSAPAAATRITPSAAAQAQQADAAQRPPDQPPEAPDRGPATAATPMHSGAPAPLPSLAATPRPPATALLHEHPLRQHTEPLQQPSAARATAPSKPVAPASRAAPVELTTPLPAMATAAEPASTSPPLLAQAQAMGVPTDTVPERRAAASVDMATLLAPPASHRAELRIDRVSVTVQSPASAAAPAMPSPAAAAAARTAAPAPRVFRNPWAGYHARRD